MLRRFIRLLLGVAVGLLLLVVVVWILSRTLGAKEVLYQGRTIKYWQTACLSTNEAERSQAITVLNTQILPDLLKTLFHDWHDSSLRLELITQLNGLPWVEIHYPSAGWRRAGAVTMLGNFGPPASAAVPALIQALNGTDDAVRQRAAISLGRIHSEPDLVIPILISYLSNPEFAQVAVEGLGGYGPVAEPAVPEILALLADSDPRLEAAIWNALQSIDPEALMNATLELQSRDDAAVLAPRPSTGSITNSAAPVSPAQ